MSMFFSHLRLRLLRIPFPEKHTSYPYVGTYMLTSSRRWPFRSARRSTPRSTRFTRCLSSSASRNRPHRRHPHCCRSALHRHPHRVLSGCDCCPRVQHVMWWVGGGGLGRGARKLWTAFDADRSCITLSHSLRRASYYTVLILTYIANPLLTSGVAICTYTSIQLAVVSVHFEVQKISLSVCAQMNA